MVEKCKKHENDTGSVEVQVAALTERIEYLSNHFKENPKDFSSKRGLLKMVSRRRTYLKHVEKNNEKLYKQLLTVLELRK